MTERKWDVVRYDGARDNRPRAEQWARADFLRLLCWPRVWARAKVDAPAWSPVVMQEGATRAASAVVSVSALVLDCDAGDPLDRLEALGADFVRYGHTSWSHTPKHPKARLVFPFATPCPVEEWARVWSAAERWAAEHGVHVDSAARDPSRLYFLAYVPWQAGEPGGNVYLEQFTTWEYWEGERLMEWARLAMRYPEPEPEAIVYTPTAGALHDTEDRHEKRRRRFARAMVEHRCRGMVAAGEGKKGAGTGRNNRTFALARLVSRLALAGCLSEAEGVGMVQAAARAAGLPQREIGRAIRNGLAAGRVDGPENVDALLTERP